MKIVNTPDGFKYIPFAGAFIKVPVDTEFLSIQTNGIVYAGKEAGKITEDGVLLIPFEEFDNFTQIAFIKGHHGAQVISIEDLMAGYV